MPVDKLIEKIAVMSQIADAWNQPGGSTLGRTVIMKLCFFLQEIKGVPLGYRFSLYSYGPYDAEVLSDLQSAEKYAVLNSQIVHYSNSTGYRYVSGYQAKVAKTMASDFLRSNENQIRWVLNKFTGRNASDLELLSTTAFLSKTEQLFDDVSLGRRVAMIKPHFSEAQIRNAIHSLRHEGVFDLVRKEFAPNHNPT